MRLQRRTKLLTGAAIALGLVIPAAGTLASPTTGSGQASTATVAPTTTTVKGSTTTTVKGSTPTTTKSTTSTTKSTTAPKSKAKTAPKAKTAVTANHFRVVAGAFPTRAQANKQLVRIKRAGQSGFVVVKSGKFFVIEDRGLAKAAAVRIVKALKAKGLAASVKG